MNTEDQPPGPPVPMVKEKTVKEDGRFLFYYTFLAENSTPATAGQTPARATEDTDV